MVSKALTKSGGAVGADSSSERMLVGTIHAVPRVAEGNAPKEDIALI